MWQISLTPNSAFPDRFYYPQGEQYGMPPRHISPQSFDDILSELGDDPAIPDPHGIRKTSTPPRVDPSPQAKPPKTAFLGKSFVLNKLHVSPISILLVILCICGGTLFFYFGLNKSGAEAEIHALQNQLFSLTEEFEFSQSEWQSDLEDLYEVIDKMEVSIHSLELKPPIQATQIKPIAIPYEAELRRWRYLGVTRMGSAEQAFFHTGKTTRMIGNGDPALGEWRLTQAAKELAILTHPKGKSITFKSIQSE